MQACRGTIRALGRLVGVFVVGVAATGCSVVGSGDTATDSSGRVVLITHESFALPAELISRFEDRSGLELEVRAVGDAGTLTNKLVLSQSNPTGDVAFGVDNTFASRALEAGVFAPYAGTLTNKLVLSQSNPTGDVAFGVDNTFASRAL
ncbi:MAG: hypothetical protein ACRCYU_09965, partial [Nocardioides sp.]